MKKQNSNATNDGNRDVVLVVGSTGYFGTGVVSELRRRQQNDDPARRIRLRLRLLGRSRAGFEKAGYLPTTKPGGELECSQSTEDGNQVMGCVVCDDTSDLQAYRDEWFRDVQVVVCVARPRSTHQRSEREPYLRMVKSLCRVARSNRVPHLLLLGLPYMGDDDNKDLPLGSNAEIDLVRETEQAAREIMNETEGGDGIAPTVLTIARVSDMTEIGFLVEFAIKTGMWPCAWNRNPVLRPITSLDFGIAVASFIEAKFLSNAGDSSDAPTSTSPSESLLLVGGPQSMRWRELREKIALVSGTHLRAIDLPLWVYKAVAAGARIGARWFTRLERASYMIVTVGIPMIVDTTNDRHEAYGDDRIDDYMISYWETSRRPADETN